MEDFIDNSAFNRWMNLLEKNNYRKREMPYKILGMVIVYLAKFR